MLHIKCVECYGQSNRVFYLLSAVASADFPQFHVNKKFSILNICDIGQLSENFTKQKLLIIFWPKSRGGLQAHQPRQRVGRRPTTLASQNI